MNVPDKISILRLALAPVLLLLSWFQADQVFLIVLALAYITDAIDGPIARRTGQQSELGPMLDTWADVCIYLSVPLCAWWLWPKLFIQEAPYFMFIIASIVFPLLAGLIRFGRTTSYHTWLTEAAAVCTTVSTLLLFTGVTPWPFRAASILCMLAGFEEILISLVLDKPASNTISLWHVYRKKRIEGNTDNGQNDAPGD